MRFYHPGTLQVGQQMTLNDEVFHHWCRVLRAQVGDTATLFNGQGGEYLASLIAIDKKSAQVSVTEFCPDERTLSLQVTLGQVMSKGDRMDYAIQKATELGVSAIQLLTSDRCEMRLKYERDQKKIDHWHAVAVAACEQCGSNRIPMILPPLPLANWVGQVEADLKLVLSLAEQPIDIPNPLPARIALLVGPEGGLTEQEIALAQQSGFIPWTIGARVLRTETAPVAALAILNYLAG